jgi:hypothetical protein
MLLSRAPPVRPMATQMRKGGFACANGSTGSETPRLPAPERTIASDSLPPSHLCPVGCGNGHSAARGSEI